MVDSFRYIDFFTRKLIRSWVAREPERDIPWTPAARPLHRSTIALVTTAGLAGVDDRPFDQAGERRNPWWGDPSYRRIPREATEQTVRAYHLHVDLRPVERDLNCALPLQRLLELEAAGIVGRSATTHYSYMGYILRPRVLLEESVPAMIAQMKVEQVDLVLLAPF